MRAAVLRPGSVEGMAHRSRLLAVLTLGFVPSLLAGCGGDEVTKEQDLDHAVEFATVATTDEAKAQYRAIFECMWPEMQKDQELLDAFMEATESTPEISADMSKMMASCFTTSVPPTATSLPTAGG